MPARTTSATDRTARHAAAALLASTVIIASLTHPASAVDRSFVGAAGGDWNTAANWSPFGVPSGIDIARLSGDTVNLSAATTGVDALYMNAGSILGNQGFRILVDDLTESASTTLTSGSLLLLTPTGQVNDMDTDNLTVSGGSVVLISGGAILDVDTTCLTFSGGAINGDGQLVIHGELNNSASLVASDGGFAANGGTLTIIGVGDGACDLDGLGDGELVAAEAGSHLIVDIELSEPTFGGTMKVRNVCTLEFTDAVPALVIDDTPGRIELEGSIFLALDTTTTLAGELVLTGGLSKIETDLVVEPGAVISLADVGTILRSDGPLTFNGGTFMLGPGELEPNGPLTIAADTTVFARVLDLDGHSAFSQNAPVTIADDVQFTFDVDAIGSGISLGAFAGHLQLDGGDLLPSIGGGAIDFTLTNGGDVSRPTRIELIDNGIGIPTFGGSSSLVVASGGSLHAINRVSNGEVPTARITVDTYFVAGTVDVGFGMQLEFDEGVTLEGGTIFTGDGTLVFTGFTRVSGGDPAVGAHVEIGDGDIIRLDAGRTLSLERGVSFFASRIDNTLGAGSGTTLSLDGDSTVYPGGVTGISSVATDTFDWDGVEREDTFTIESGATFIVDSARLDGGFNEYADTILISDGGTLIVNTLEPWRLRDNIGLAQAWLALTGPDAVVDGQLLENRGLVAGNGQVLSAFINDGGVFPSAVGDPTATLTFGSSYLQRPGGNLIIAIEGAADGEFDQIVATGPAALDGELSVTLVDEYVPPIGTTFTILEAASVTGEFGVVDADTPPGLDWSIDYGPDYVTLEVVSTCADMDGNGQVGFADLIEVLNAWGPCGAPCPEDLDASGGVGFNDVTILLNAWGVCPQA